MSRVYRILHFEWKRRHDGRVELVPNVVKREVIREICNNKCATPLIHIARRSSQNLRNRVGVENSWKELNRRWHGSSQIVCSMSVMRWSKMENSLQRIQRSIFYTSLQFAVEWAQKVRERNRARRGSEQFWQWLACPKHATFFSSSYRGCGTWQTC